MKKTIILLIAFIVLGGLAYKFMGDGNANRGTVDGDFEKMFAIENPDQIYKVFIADRKGNNTTLTRNGDEWLLNGEHKVRQTAIDNLLDAMTRVRVKFRPADSAVDYMVQNLSTAGIKVEAYDKAGKKIKAYYVGGSSQDNHGSSMILEGADEPLVAYIPNWVGSLYNRFSLIGEEWRDRHVFEVEVEKIQSVKMEYPDPDFIQHSFLLERKGRDEYSVTPLYATTQVIDKPVSPGKVEAFLVEFESKIAEAFRNTHKDRENVVKQLPFCVITLNTTDGKEKRVKLFPIYQEDKIVGDKGSTKIISNRPVFRYFAEIDGKELVLVQHTVFGELFWPYELFF